ncbi:hypothetical protein IscW_ISCW007325, partial [Ixodes scapularis]
ESPALRPGGVHPVAGVLLKPKTVANKPRNGVKKKMITKTKKEKRAFLKPW